MSSRGEGVARLLKAATPMLLGLAGVIILALPLRLFDGFVPTPILPLVIVYFWSIYAPSYLPSPSVFAIGLFQDFLTGGPLGLWPAVYLVVQYIVLSQRSYFSGREQKVVWLGFAFIAAGASFILWTVMSLMSGIALPIWGLLLQMVATVLAYPVFSAVFAQLHVRVIVER